MHVAWKPNKGPQTRFLASPAFIVLYGGARGGGKSEALLADVCRQVDPRAIAPRVRQLHPELDEAEVMRRARRSARRYRAVIFRRTYKELEDLMDRAKEKIPQWFPGAKWDETKKLFRFPSGAIVRFRYLRHKNDWRQYRGWEITYLGYEEATHFDEDAFTKVLPSCRTSDPYLVKYVRLTTNPGGVGHAWIRAKFVDAAPWGQIYWRDGLSWQFIPARVYDNPALLDADPDYVRILESLPEAERRAMLEGDWDAFEGQFFAFNRAYHIVTWAQLAAEAGMPLKPDGTCDIPEHWPIFMSMDWGYGAPFSIGWWTVDQHGRAFRLREWYGCKRDRHGNPMPNEGLRMTDEAIARGILDREARWEWTQLDAAGRPLRSRVKMRVADPAMFNRRAISATIQGPPLSEEYARHGVALLAGDNSRVPGWQQLHQRLQLFQLDADRESAAILILEECKDWIRTVPSLPRDEKDIEDVDSDAEDHAADETRYFLMARPWTPKAPLSDREKRRIKRRKSAGFGVQ